MQKEVTLTASSSAASSPIDVSEIVSGDWSIRIQIDGPADLFQLSLEDSLDSFTNRRTLAVINPAGVDGRVEFTFRPYQLPSARLGVQNAKLRMFLQSISGGAVNAKLFVTY